MAEFQNPEVFRLVLDSLHTGILITDRSGKILFWNEGAEHIAGHIRHDVIGRSQRETILPNCEGRGCSECGKTCPFARTLHEGKPTEIRTQIHHKQGHLVPVRLRVAAIRDSHGSVVATAASFEAERRYAHADRDQRHPVPQGCLDDTTGVASHGFTEFHLRENFAGFVEYHVPFSIICARAEDLEHFRAAYGRPAGDALLRVMAQNLSNNFRPSDFIGRWTENEFLVILMNCPGLGAERALDRVHRVVTGASIRWWGEQIFIPMSFGYAAAEPGDTVDALVQRARRFPDFASAGTLPDGGTRLCASVKGSQG
jgi:diguanylate cyclase (GGDEF)-like protein/PAS domain S-box-containing protein